MSSGPPQPYFAEILRRGDSSAAGGKRKPHLRIWRRWGWVWLNHQGVERSVSLVCGKNRTAPLCRLRRYLLCVGKTFGPSNYTVQFKRRLLRVGKTLSGMRLISRHKGSRFDDRCPVRQSLTKVSASVWVRAHLSPTVVEILRRGGNTAVLLSGRHHPRVGKTEVMAAIEGGVKRYPPCAGKTILGRQDHSSE